MIDAHTHNPVPPSADGIRSIRYGIGVTDVPQCRFSLGIHPWDADANADLKHFEQLAANADAIGECGLDKCCAVGIDRQAELFEWQVNLAEQLQKPVVVHCVRAYGRLMEFMARHADVRWLVHGCYASTEWIRAALKYNVWFSVGPSQLQMPRANEVLRAIPADRLLLETDDSGCDIGSVYSSAGILPQALDANFARWMGQ